MPQQQQEFPLEQADKKYIVFNEFGGMNTQSARVALDNKQTSWQENLQPVANNQLATIPGILPGSISINDTILRMFYAFFNSVEQLIVFGSSGAAYTYNLTNQAVHQFAPPGTFSGVTDCTCWQGQRILIADPSAKYCTYDGTLFVQQGQVSPNIALNTGGSGYTSVPTVTISGGTGAGATATARIAGGAVIGITLTAAGSGYSVGDVLTVSFGGPGTGATATAIVWPFISIAPISLAIYQSRVWFVSGRTLVWTGTKGYDDFSLLNASGLLVYPDNDIPRVFKAIRSLNNYLYLFGDNSVRLIGTITVASGITSFATTTLSSDVGCDWIMSIVSYNRLVVFANTIGIYAIYGASVEKISGPMDTVFQGIDFSQEIQAGQNDIRNQRTLLVLAKYKDTTFPGLGTRAIIMSLTDKKWFICSQGNNIKCLASAPLGDINQSFASSGGDITQIIAAVNVAVPWIWQTALSSDRRPHIGKRAIRFGVTVSIGSTGQPSIVTESEQATSNTTTLGTTAVTWINNSNIGVFWINNALAGVTFVDPSVSWVSGQGAASGMYLGLTMQGNNFNTFIYAGIIEYQDAAVMRSANK